MLTPKQAAERIGVSDSLVYEWCAAGLLPHYRFGRKGKRGCIRIDASELDAFLARCADRTWWTQTIAFTAVHARTPGS